LCKGIEGKRNRKIGNKEIKRSGRRRFRQADTEWKRIKKEMRSCPPNE